MKTIFIIKLTLSDNQVGYFDGNSNWSKYLYSAKQFDSYTLAELFLQEMANNAGYTEGWKGMVQIEKYFISE